MLAPLVSEDVEEEQVGGLKGADVYNGEGCEGNFEVPLALALLEGVREEEEGRECDELVEEIAKGERSVLGRGAVPAGTPVGDERPCSLVRFREASVPPATLEVPRSAFTTPSLRLVATGRKLAGRALSVGDGAWSSTNDGG